MKILTRYHRASGTIVGRRLVPDNYDADDSNAELGIYQGEADPARQYVTADGLLADRLEVAGLSVSKKLIAANGTDAFTITGLPESCWLRVNGVFVQADGSHAITSTVEGTITVQLAGAHCGPEITLRVGDAIDLAFADDPRWQALQSATPAQIDNWLTANVTTIAQARSVLRLLLLAVRRLTR